MRVYQCIHKYPPHIPLFEQRYGVTDDMDFETLRRLVVSDGYASSYILLPALQDKPEEVFYALWDYERLQYTWAREHGFNTRDLDKIKLAQIEEYKPDVFYNMSPFCDNGFIRKLGKNKYKSVYWNGIIEPVPKTYGGYDGQLSLHRPHVEYWKAQGLAACELQPGIPEKWRNIASAEKPVDVLFYGQYGAGFSSRNNLVEALLAYKPGANRDIRCHLQMPEQGKTIFKIPGLPWSRVRLPFSLTQNRGVRKQVLPPLYGEELYTAIGRAKIVVNAYTDHNLNFKSNMRLFEAIGLGAFLISEMGCYPEGFESGVDFYPYKGAQDLFFQIERVLADWPLHAEMARMTQKKITGLYGKERQWDVFQGFIASL